MRLLVKLRCIEDTQYEMHYHYHLQGFIYNLLKGSKYDYLHNKEGYKFFCFSNIFPAKDLVRNDIRTLIISSPDDEFVFYLLQIFDQPWNKTVRVGKMKFIIERTQILETSLPSNDKYSLITGTPIIVRANRNTYSKYGIKPRFDYEYVYWRTEYPVEMFLFQLETNLRKKYQEFWNLSQDKDRNRSDRSLELGDTQMPSLFCRAGFKKQISTRLTMKGFEEIVIATVWEFMFEGWENKKLLQFALDAGLGERNSLGFGFMNLAKDKEQN
jgi:CRISPR-associated endoribonuclease Cas6